MDKREKYGKLNGIFMTWGAITILFLVIFGMNLAEGKQLPNSAVLMKVFAGLLLQGLSMYLYLSSVSLHHYAVLFASVAYAFGEYTLSTVSRPENGILIIFPLILLGIEKWLKQGRTLVLLLTLCLACLCSFPHFYCAGLLAAAYLILRLYRRGEKILPKVILLLFYGIMACLLGSFALLSQAGQSGIRELFPNIGGYENRFSLFVPRFQLCFTVLEKSVRFGAGFLMLFWVYFLSEKAMRKRLLSDGLLLFALSVFPVFSLILSGGFGVGDLWTFLFPAAEALLTAIAVECVFKSENLSPKTVFSAALLSFLTLFVCNAALSIGLNDFWGNLTNRLFLNRKGLLLTGIFQLALMGILLLPKIPGISAFGKKALVMGGLFCLTAANIMANCRHFFEYIDYNHVTGVFSQGNSFRLSHIRAGGTAGMVLSACCALLVIIHYTVYRKRTLPAAAEAELVIARLEEKGLQGAGALVRSVQSVLRHLCSRRLFRYSMAALYSVLFVLGGLVLFPSLRALPKEKLFLVMAAGTAVCMLLITKFMTNVERHSADYEKRSSNVELCRILCMLLVILHHYALHGGSFFLPDMNSNKLYALFLAPGGKLSFDCFLAISCWFLVDRKFSARHFMRTWLQVLFYTVSFTAIAGLLGRELTGADWLGAFLPLTGNSHNFAGAYLALYLLTPFLAPMTERLSRRQARWLMAVLLCLEAGTRLVNTFTLYNKPLYSDLLLFMLCYVTAFNLKRWPVKIMENRRALFCIFLSVWFSMWITEYAFLQYPGNRLIAWIEANMFLASSVNNLLGGFAMFFWFLNLKIRRPVPLLNALAGGTFGVLLMHDHNFFRNILWGSVLQAPLWHESRHMVLHSLAAALWIYTLCFAIDRLRKNLLEKNIMKISRLNTFCDKCDVVINGKEGR